MDIHDERESSPLSGAAIYIFPYPGKRGRNTPVVTRGSSPGEERFHVQEQWTSRASRGVVSRGGTR